MIFIEAVSYLPKDCKIVCILCSKKYNEVLSRVTWTHKDLEWRYIGKLDIEVADTIPLDISISNRYIDFDDKSKHHYCRPTCADDEPYGVRSTPTELDRV